MDILVLKQYLVIVHEDELQTDGLGVTGLMGLDPAGFSQDWGLSQHYLFWF